MRHASLITVVCRDSTPMTIFWSQPPFAQHHLLILLPGRYSAFETYPLDTFFLDTPIKYYNMICRIWHGYTTDNNADTYENLLKEEIFVGIKNRNINGYRGIQLLRRQLDLETEFITIMWFDSVESVKEFAGNDYEKAVVPDKAQKVLSHFDKRSQHYEIKEQAPLYLDFRSDKK
jgi:heme-degrading monooxygenase HmoA